MDEKDMVDAYVRLYHRQMTHYEKTQDVEWKISFGVWGLLAAALYWSAQNAAATNSVQVAEWLGVLAFVVPLMHGFWLWRVHESEEFDKRLWSRYRVAARTILLAPEMVPRDEQETTRSMLDKAMWILLEAGITLVMVVALRAFLR